MTDDAGLRLDFRSDAITLPTVEMWEAMRSADLGWSHVGEDEQVRELEAEVAALAGKPAALLVQTGSLANLLAVMSQSDRGEQLILDASSHLAWSEEWGVAYGLFPRLLPSIGGQMQLGEVRQAVETTMLGHHPRTSLLCLESSHNFAGGAALGLEYLRPMSSLARHLGVRTHLDGARIFNSCAALDEDPGEVMRLFDSVVINLNKGLSAPGGAVLAGDERFVERCRLNMRRIGGSPGHQAGILAAAGLVALRTMRPQLDQDNRRAGELAARFDGLEAASVDLAGVQTNIVRVRVVQAPRVASELERRGVRALVLADDELRFVTHRHITDESLDRAQQILEEVLTCSTP